MSVLLLKASEDISTLTFIFFTRRNLSRHSKLHDILRLFRGAARPFRTVRRNRKYQRQNRPEHWQIERIRFYRLQQRGSHRQGGRRW